ncbi:hypothetical protein FBZ98_1011044 [Rhizobium sp. ERR 922]|uniref:hypothetical protein n=1 Tax=unclassified Rhizobium TaxID=2613769 RepID=UPI0011AB2810|nr:MULTISPECIES: hypothetical protein [unclassified Rhizobium]TWB61699.1 hypothetical protein FBZ98_1011044 [Rhizobium sp. ERR 922]TWC04625.1 hypothetical protein FBZ97_1011044 [Rhizobium sp. ERR 942]
MGSFINQPTVPILYLRPTRASFDVVGSSIDGGTNSTGESISIEIGGGGRVTATYERCVLQGDDTERHEVINWLGARGNGGFRFFNVPIINDGIGPFPVINGKRRPIIDHIPHSDGSLFSDTSGYSQASVYAVVTANAVVGAGVIQMQVFGAARPLRWSDWFSIYHPTKGWRAYRYWEVQSVSSDANPIYTLAIGPALREAITVGTRVELARPMCVMKFPKGFSLPWDYEAWYQSRPTLQFTEAF